MSLQLFHKDLHTDKSMIVTISEWMRSDVFGFVSLKVCDMSVGVYHTIEIVEL
jgi:hypothetical protein